MYAKWISTVSKLSIGSTWGDVLLHWMHAVRELYFTSMKTHTSTDLHLEEDQLWFVPRLLFSLSYHNTVPVATSLDDLLRICMTSSNHQMWPNTSWWVQGKTENMAGSQVTDINAVSFAFGPQMTIAVPKPMQWWLHAAVCTPCSECTQQSSPQRLCSY